MGKTRQKLLAVLMNAALQIAGHPSVQNGVPLLVKMYIQYCSIILGHCEARSDAAIQPWFTGHPGLLRCARNDEGGLSLRGAQRRGNPDRGKQTTQFHFPWNTGLRFSIKAVRPSA